MLSKNLKIGLFAPLVAMASIATWGSARADVLTPAGAAEFTLSTFADSFPTTGFCCGPLGIAFPTSGGVMVADYPGNVRVFPTDTDGQHASSVPPAAFFGSGNGVGLASSGGNIFMTEQAASTVVQLNNSGTFNQTIVTGIPGATGIATNPVTGHLYVSALGNGIIYEIDPVAKTATPIIGVYADGLTVNSAGTKLFAEVGGHILGYDTSTHLQIFDSGGIPGGPDGTAIGATGSLAGKLFVNTNGGELYEINTTTLAQTLILTGGSRGDFVTVDPLNGTLLITRTDQILRLTPISGGFDVNPTPLPAALPLFASGMGVLGFFGWRRQRRMSKHGA